MGFPILERKKKFHKKVMFLANFASTHTHTCAKMMMAIVRSALLLFPPFGPKGFPFPSLSISLYAAHYLGSCPFECGYAVLHPSIIQIREKRGFWARPLSAPDICQRKPLLSLSFLGAIRGSREGKSRSMIMSGKKENGRQRVSQLN